MKHPIKSKIMAIMAISALAYVLPSHAAIITWGDVQNISGDSDVSTDGISVYAFDLGPNSGTDTIVNGVTFTSSSPSGILGEISFGDSPTRAASPFGSSSDPFNSLSTDYKTILSSAVYKSNAAFTIILENLAIGAQYQVQVWTQDARNLTSTQNGAGTIFSTAGGDSVSMLLNTGNGTGSENGFQGGTGQYVLGSFVATATTQEITLAPLVSSGSVAHINALQLRQIPEPDTYALMAGICSIMGIAALRPFSRH